MALKKVGFTLTQGGLARSLPNEDHVSCLLFEFSQPTSWGGSQIRTFRNLQQVEAADILATDPLFAEVHYHVSEFFRINPNAHLWIAFSTLDAEDIISASAGKIRQYGISRSYSLTNCNSLGDFANSLAELDASAVVLMGAADIDFDALLPAEEPRNQSNPYLSILVAGDDGAEGALIADSLGLPYLPSVGAVLGAISLAQVHESMAWVAKFNFAKTELETYRFPTGGDISDAGALDFLDDLGFLFFRKFVGVAGTYLNDTHAAVAITSDYAFIENNRTVQKAIRLIQAALLPQLNSPLYVDADGKISPSTVGYFKSLAEAPINTNMLNQGELSGFAIDIDPEQNVLATSLLVVQVRLQPVGVAREILVTIGLTTNLS